MLLHGDLIEYSVYGYFPQFSRTIKVSPSDRPDGNGSLVLSCSTSYFGAEPELSTVMLSPDDSRTIWDILECFELQDVRSGGATIDGPTCHLETNCNYLHMSLKWYLPTPRGWTGPIRLIEELERLAEPPLG
ncbi:MAG TPA: hypothetical protein VIL17_04150 [Coriobacteriia bacterium]